MKKEYPKIMLVWENNTPQNIFKRVVFAKKGRYYIAWRDATTIDDSLDEVYTSCWDNAKDIEPKEEDKEVNHLLKDGDCVKCDNKGEFKMILNIANKYNVKVYEKTSEDSYEHYKHMIYSDNLLQGATTHHVSNHTIPQFIKKMIGVEDKPKVIHENINGVDIEFKNNMMFINHRDVKIVFREENVKEMLHTLEEMK